MGAVRSDSLRSPQARNPAVSKLADEATQSGGTAVIEVDLEDQTVESASGEVFTFNSPVRPRQMLLKNVDEIGLTLTYTPAIQGFRNADSARRPWAYPT